MHLNDAIFQLIIAQIIRNGFEILKYLQKFWADTNEPNYCALAKLYGTQIEKNGELVVEFLNKVDNIVLKLKSVDEKNSDSLKIAMVFKAMPQENNSFIAAIQF